MRYSLSDALKLRLGGERESVFRAIEDHFRVDILTRMPGLFLCPKDQGDLEGAVSFLDQLKLDLRQDGEIDLERVLHILTPINRDVISPSSSLIHSRIPPILRNRYGQPVAAKTEGQFALLRAVDTHDVVFVNGPAGTGKTYLAVALAVSWLEEKRVERICLVRPAVEAGETLGFLPGDLREKIAPYLRPLYDVLNEMLPPDKMQQYHENGQIEVAPLAYMRGRTLKRSFIILDEAQNTTIPQMKMFLTRLGAHSKALIAGDRSQSDLDSRTPSGFAHALGLLMNVPGIAQLQFKPTEALRHRLVQDILTAYDGMDV